MPLCLNFSACLYSLTLTKRKVKKATVSFIFELIDISPEKKTVNSASQIDAHNYGSCK